MPRAWQYPRWRHILMQVTLCLILAVTVGLAFIVQRATDIALTPPQTVADLVLRLPANWTTVRDAPTRADVIVDLRNPTGERSLTVYRPDTSRVIPLWQDIKSQNGRAFQVAGRTWVLGVKSLGDAEAPTVVAQYRTAVIIASGEKSVVIDLRVVQPRSDALPNPRDEAIIQRVTESIEFHDAPTTATASDIVFEQGLRVDIPPGFTLYNNADPFFTERVLIHDDAQRPVAIQLVPCFFSPDDKNLPAALHDLMAARVDADKWIGAQTRSIGPLTWRFDADPTQPGDIAFLRASDSGSAILCIFSAPIDSTIAENLWPTLAAGIHFNNATPMATLEHNGTQDATRLGLLGLEKFVPTQGNTWYLCSQRGVAVSTQPTGWLCLRWNKGEAWTLHSTLLLRDDDGKVLWTELHTFAQSDFGHLENELLIRQHTSHGWITQLKAQTYAQDGFYRTRDAHQSGAHAALTTQFISGAWLPLLVAQLSPRPMLLRTEVLAGIAGYASDRPWMLFIHPAEPAATLTGSSPARVMAMELNGSGRVSRWNLDRDGSLLSIELPSGLYARRATASEIRANFGNNSDLDPLQF